MNQNGDKFVENNSKNESKKFAQNCDIYADIETQTHIELNLNNNKLNCINSTEKYKPNVNCDQCSDDTGSGDQNKQLIATNDDIEAHNSVKRSIDSDNSNYNCIKRIKTKQTFDYLIRHFKLGFNNSEFSSHECQTNSVLENSHKSSNKSLVVDTCDDNNDNQLVPIDQNNDKKVCDMSDDKDWTPKKTPKKTSKQVKWRSNLINPDFSEDSLLNTRLSETYYYYGTGIVTGEAGDMFGGNRFQGFSRHLLSDSTGITVELCKPFIINEILFELENKSHKKSPLFAYKVLIAIDECMTDWQLIQDFDQMVCFGRQKIRFYPRIVQYIRIVGSHGIYSENDRECEARYLTLLNFDCILDQKLIQ